MFKCYLCNYNSNSNKEIIQHNKNIHNNYFCEPKDRKNYKHKNIINFYKCNDLKIQFHENHKDFIARTIHKYNYYEPLISIIFLKILNDNKEDIFIDIGSNIGYYCLLCNKSAKDIHAFEPLEQNYDILNKNLKINNIDNVILNKKIISPTKNKMSFSYGTSRICEKGNIYVDNIILDEYYLNNNIKKIKLIKIDVEGHEIEVLKTMNNILSNKISQYIFIEVTNHTFNNVINIMKDNNYKNIYDLNTGFIFTKYNLNETIYLNLDNILENYKLTNFQSRNTNLLFTY